MRSLGVDHELAQMASYALRLVKAAGGSTAGVAGDAISVSPPFGVSDIRVRKNSCHLWFLPRFHRLRYILFR
jgi:hypothetical protein